MDYQIIKKIEKMKKYISTISFTKITLLVFMLITTLVNAQTDLPEAPVDEPAVAPIDTYVFVLAALGLVFVFLKVRASMNQEKSQVK
ncbi:MAG: hypothetical protein GZ087_06630 [Flavobacterium sp.]|nr:hypothetical protein [Flavobacterium sp.]